MENNTNVKVDSNVKLSFLERFAYGMGDYAGNLHSCWFIIPM